MRIDGNAHLGATSDHFPLLTVRERRHYEAKIRSLEARGFDRCELQRRIDGAYVHIGCTQCAAVAIDGVACHEGGCPNATKECAGCSARIPARAHVRWCAECGMDDPGEFLTRSCR